MHYLRPSGLDGVPTDRRRGRNRPRHGRGLGQTPAAIARIAMSQKNLFRDLTGELGLALRAIAIRAGIGAYLSVRRNHL